MRIQGLAALLGITWVAACGGSSDQGQRVSSNQSTSGECNIITTADIQAVTGATVKRIERGAAVGAGGTCVNFASADGQAYLGVNALLSQGEYTASVNAVPSEVYPTREPQSGLGDEAVLFKGPGGVRYLVARLGSVGVVLFPMGDGAGMSDDQLRQLASRALSAPH